MSSSSAATVDSRSPSPHTPEASDPTEPLPIQTGLDPPISWFIPMPQPKSEQPPWEADPSIFVPSRKLEDEQMLRLDDLLEQHAFDDASPHFPHNTTFLPSQQSQTNDSPSNSQQNSFVPNFRPSNLLVPSRNGPISVTKPVPPPASLPRKLDNSSHNQRVVHPPRESCFNLPIMFPSIPEGGTKSRVETQVRVTVDLADSSSSSDPRKYDRVGSWKWLKLPPGTSTKRRTRKQGKIDALPQDTLNLVTEVVCASAPGVPVVSCSSCRTREAKRVAKKIAARVRPARSDSESAAEDPSAKPTKKPAHEDTNSIIQFNCAEVLDFSTGSVVLPLRITCYCRHHREKVGFLVRFTMVDHVARVVGTGISKPIMITDDHKTASTNSRQTDYVNTFSGPEPDWSQMSPVASEPSPSDLRAPSRRKDKTTGPFVKRRPKPYDASAKPCRGSREGSVSSQPSPSTTYSPLPLTRPPTPSSMLQNFMAVSEAAAKLQTQTQTPIVPSLQPSFQGSDSSSPDLLSTPLDHNSDVHMPEVFPHIEPSSVPESPNILQTMPQLHQILQTPSVLQQSQSQSSAMLVPSAQATLPFMFFEQNQSGSLTLQMPSIHRLIPNMGPTYGGIEVTVLGANFHPSLNLRCIFGEAVANSTQRWSDNTLVCVLPPRAQPGVVAVWFEGLLEHPNTPPSLFTYSDESDRALMELALQVVGLKMTGKIEDAKNVAMRIVGGSAGNEGSDSRSGNSNLMQLTNVSGSSLGRDFRPLFFIRAGEITENYESMVVDFLSILDTPLEEFAPSSIPTIDAISYPTATGQTLLHLAAFMCLSTLVSFLVEHNADLDARDRNGFTPLHFAALSGSEDCARILLRAGADREIVNSLGKTAEEIAAPGLFGNILLELPSLLSNRQDDDGDDGDIESDAEDEEAEWGDAEKDADEVKDGSQIRRLLRKKAPKRAMQKVASANASGRGTPRRSLDVSRAVTPPLPFSEVNIENSNTTIEELTPSTSTENQKGATVDAKQTASFIEMIQRTLSQLPPATGIIPNIPYLSKPQFPGLPGLPNLPDFGGMPWAALPQIPMVFPVFVPMPAWPSFLGGSDENDSQNDSADDQKTRMAKEAGENVGETKPVVAGRNAQEWRTIWEKWVAMAIATTARQQQRQVREAEEDVPPPEYTPRADDVSGSVGLHSGKGKAKASMLSSQGLPREVETDLLHDAPVVTSNSSRPHPVGYSDTPIPAEEVDAYTYQPSAKQKHKKHDRMLLLFWLPILLLSMVWAFHVYQTLRTALPLKAEVRHT